MSLYNEILGTAFLTSLFYFFIVLIDIEKRPAYAVALIRGIPVGAILVLLMAFANSIVEGRWDSNYVFLFLKLNDVGQWLFRILTGLGYIFVAWGIASTLALGVKFLIKRQ